MSNTYKVITSFFFRKLSFDDQINWRNLVEQIILDLNSEQKLCQGKYI